MSLLALALLAIVDAGFAGYRDAAGRDGRVFKLEFYRRAVRRGLGGGAVVVALSSVWVVAALLGGVTSPAELEATARLGLLMALSYAALVLLALGVWSIAEADLRSLSGVILLGPFTLLRPLLIVAMLTSFVTTAPTRAASVTLVVPGVLQLCLEWWLGRAWRHGARPCG
jgi:hypothetical protein